jgi:hypothetical protein
LAQKTPQVGRGKPVALRSLIRLAILLFNLSPDVGKSPSPSPSPGDFFVGGKKYGNH